MKCLELKYFDKFKTFFYVYVPTTFYSIRYLSSSMFPHTDTKSTCSIGKLYKEKNNAKYKAHVFNFLMQCFVKTLNLLGNYGCGEFLLWKNRKSG